MIMERTCHGVQQRRKTPRIIVIVRNAFLARFSLLLFFVCGCCCCPFGCCCCCCWFLHRSPFLSFPERPLADFNYRPGWYWMLRTIGVVRKRRVSIRACAFGSSLISAILRSINYSLSFHYCGIGFGQPRLWRTSSIRQSFRSLHGLIDDQSLDVVVCDWRRKLEHVPKIILGCDRTKRRLVFHASAVCYRLLPTTLADLPQRRRWIRNRFISSSFPLKSSHFSASAACSSNILGDSLSGVTSSSFLEFSVS